MIIYEATPNPNSLKFISDRVIADETVFFENQNQAKRSPLASKLFGFPWASAVMIGSNFVTVTKQDWVDWQVIAEPLSDLINEHLERGEGVLLPAIDEANAELLVADEANDDPVVDKIKSILNKEIRPAVAMDGGDIVFHKFEEGRLFVHLQGACSGCPSSMFTLKDGIEARLKQDVPELIEVVSV